MNLKSISTLVFILAASLCSLPANAAIFTTVNNDTVSRFDATTDPANIVLFAGYDARAQGACLGAGVSMTTVCDSCTDFDITTDFMCVARSVGTELPLSISFRVDAVSAGATVQVQVDNTTGTPITLTQNTHYTVTNATPAANETVTVAIPWRNICSTATNNTCTLSDTFNMTVGLSAGSSSGDTSVVQKFTVNFHYADPANYTSLVPITTPTPTATPFGYFFNFKTFPGDKKAYIQETALNSAGPTDFPNVKWLAMRVFHASFVGAPDFTQIPLGTANAAYEDVAVEGTFVAGQDGSVKLGNNGIVTSGLDNEVNYMFNVATVDQTTVVSGFFNPTTLTLALNTATPGEVVGLLDGKKCFIATAAFGSPMAPQVELLRQFRNHFLLPHAWGREFVRTYYRLSPPVANFIAEHDSLRAVVRGFLWPLIYFAQASNHYGFVPTLVVFFFSLGMLFSLSRHVIQWRKSGEA